MADVPSYPYEPIGFVDSLSLHLGFSKDRIMHAAAHHNTMYRFVPQKKADGSIREAWDAHALLKSIQEAIKTHIFEKVHYPGYLYGGLKHRDYVAHCKQHVHRKVLITEDISSFFPSISEQEVYKLWKRFFHFPDEVAHCLTALTTYNGFVPQGAKTSGYIANLIFWDQEPDIAHWLERKGLTYTRYVDDMVISSSRHLDPGEKQAIISTIYGMLKKKGCRRNRRKHKISHQGKQMLVHKKLVNGTHPALPRKERANIRAAVKQLEMIYPEQKNTAYYQRRYNHVSGLVGKLKKFHPALGDLLRQRLREIKPQKA